MKFLAFCSLFIIGAIVGMAVIPLLPGGAQEWIADFQHGVRAMRVVENTGSQNPRPTSTPRPTTSALPTRTPRPGSHAQLDHYPSSHAHTRSDFHAPADANAYVHAFADSHAHAITPAGPTSLRIQALMLELINEEREIAAVGPVTMGNNVAAQVHAEISLANCTGGHWGVDGLKPYMRYSLAGGYHSNGENGSGLDYCIKASKAIAGWTA